MEQIEPKHPIRPTDLAEKMGWSVPYASQVLNARRPPSIGTALAIFDKTGVKLGPLNDASEEEIAFARKLADAA